MINSNEPTRANVDLKRGWKKYRLGRDEDVLHQREVSEDDLVVMGLVVKNKHGRKKDGHLLKEKTEMLLVAASSVSKWLPSSFSLNHLSEWYDGSVLKAHIRRASD